MIGPGFGRYAKKVGIYVDLELCLFFVKTAHNFNVGVVFAVTELEKRRMQSIIMAPDGEIPNSVLRIHFKPFLAVQISREVSDESKLLQDSRAILFDVRRGMT